MSQDPCIWFQNENAITRGFLVREPTQAKGHNEHKNHNMSQVHGTPRI